MGAINKQQRMSNILLAGNLYKSHKIDKGLQKIAELQKIAMSQNAKMQEQSNLGKEMIAKQERGNKIAEKQLNIQITQAQEIQKTKLLKNIFFEISEEVEDVLEEKKITTIEKYFRYGSIKATLEKNGIDIEITDELSEKKLIRDTIKKVENEISKAEKKFTKEDKKDLEEIYQTFEVDEESEIKKLNSSSDIARLKELTKKLKIWFEKAKKLGGYGGLLFVLPSNMEYNSTDKKFYYNENIMEINRDQAKKKGNLLLPLHFKDEFAAKNIFKNTGLENLPLMFLNPKLFQSWYNRHFRAFFAGVEFEKASNSIRYIMGLDNTLWPNPVKKFQAMQVETLPFYYPGKHLVGARLKKILESYPGEMEKFIPYCSKAFNNPFPKATLEKITKKSSEQNKDKIEALKKDIKDEKTKLLTIFKKHPFVKTIISNR